MSISSFFKTSCIMKKMFTTLGLAVLLLVLTLTLRGLSRKAKRSAPSSPSIESILPSLPRAEFTPTQHKVFGEDGVHFFSNLYYKSSQFLIALPETSSVVSVPSFFGQGEYNYSVKPLALDQFSHFTKSISPYKFSGTTLILASSKEMKNLQPHYFHFLEEFILAWSAHKDFLTPGVQTIIFPDINHWEGVNQINKQILEALIPGVKVFNKSQFKEFTDKYLLQFENAVVVDRQGCHNLKPVATYNKMVLGHAHLIKDLYLKEMRDRILTNLKTQAISDRPKTITYINRKNRRYLEPEFEKKFISSLKKAFPEYKVQTVWFEKMKYAQQLQVIRNTDILIGAHGNGLTHSYFLPDQALVLEIFPEGAFAMDYQLISELSGHPYYAIEPKEGIISFSGHHMKPRGNVNQVIQEFDMNWVLGPITKHIQSLEETGAEKETSL